MKTGCFGAMLNVHIWFEKLTNYSLVQIVNAIFCVFIFFWFFEWSYFFEYTLEFYSLAFTLFPYKISILLLVCLVFWIYVWGVSVWRRTQYGRFTRGDRKLWMKGFASFWVVEVVTLTGLLLVSCWMSWGPIVYIPRRFWFPKKGFMFELTLFTYVLWLVYLMRFSLKWQLWRTQYTITLIIVLILFLLVWRDLITLMFREWVDMDNGSNWRFRKPGEVIFSISNNWWLESYMGHFYRDTLSYYSPIEYIIKGIFEKKVIHPLEFENILPFKEYDSYNWLPFTTQYHWWLSMGATLNPLWKANPYYLYVYNDPVNCLFASIFQANLGIVDFTNYGGFFYPRKIGFLPKRVAMWFFLVIIKIWHHFMLFIWWFFYLLRLINRRKSSYTLLSTCYFNLYCCYIIGFLVYLYHVLPFLAMMLRYRPAIQSSFHWYSTIFNALYYIFFSFFGDIFLFKSNHNSLKEMSYLSFFSIESSIVSDSSIRNSKNSHFNILFNFAWDRSYIRYTNRSIAAVSDRCDGLTWYSKSFFDNSVDVYNELVL